MKPIPGLLGYFADEHGNLFSRKRYERICKLHPRKMSRDGRRIVNLSVDGKIKTFKVAFLVLTTFVGPRPNGMLACHGPNGCSDDSLNNLYWGTPKQNNGQDRVRDGTIKTISGENHHSHKLTEENVHFIRKHYSSHGKNGISQSELSKMFHVKAKCIREIIRFQTWRYLD